jgi:hypothetical protein
VTFDAVYWGAWGRYGGHSFHAAVHHPSNVRPEDDVPAQWRRSPSSLWPKLCPPDFALQSHEAREASEPQGVAVLHHLDGWTALAFYDRTFDTRYGCGAVFFLRGDLVFAAALAKAREAFDVLFRLFKHPVIPLSDYLKLRCSFCGNVGVRHVESSRAHVRICDRCVFGARGRLAAGESATIDADVLETPTIETITIAARERRG